MSEISGLYKLKSLCNMYGTLELSPARVARKPTEVTRATGQKVRYQELEKVSKMAFPPFSRSVRCNKSRNLFVIVFVSNNQNYKSANQATSLFGSVRYPMLEILDKTLCSN